MNTIAEGKSAQLPDQGISDKRSPNPALVDLTKEITQASELIAAGNAAGARSLSSMQSRTDLKVAAVNELVAADPEKKAVAAVTVDKTTAERWADLDTRDFARMRSDERRTVAIDVIASNMRVSPEYGEAISKRSPVLAHAGRLVNQEIDNQQVIKDKDNAAARGKDESDSRASMRQATLDAAALAAVANVRAAQLAEVSARLRKDPDSVLGKSDIADAQRGLNKGIIERAASSIPLTNGPERESLEAQKLAIIKRPVLESELPDSIRGRFIVSAEKPKLFEQSTTDFTFKNGNRQGELAFTDAGKRITTVLEDKATIQAMLEVAKTKNWKEVTVSGTDEFRKQAWREARLANIEVRGYEPKEADKKLLAELQKNTLVNSLTAVDRDKGVSPDLTAARISRQSGVHINGDDLSPSEKTGMTRAKAILDSKAMSPEFSAATLKELEKKVRGERVFIGEVVDHGKAPYVFKKENDESYFITLKTQTGEQTVWGKGIEQALAKGEVKNGEQIVLRNPGQDPVTVKEKLFNEQGQLTGTRDKEAILNKWTAEPLSRHNEQARVAANIPAPESIAVKEAEHKAPSRER
jgi:hypothetical protein